MRIHLVAAATVAVMVAAAAPVQAKDRNGYHAIAARDFAAAERRLDAERRIFPNKPELLINLASVYRRTGRDADARSLYQAVLDREPVELSLPNGEGASSHALAHAGLRRLDGPTLAAR